MPTATNPQPRLVTQFRPAVVERPGALRQIRQHVQFGKRGGQFAQRRETRAECHQQLVIQLLLAGQSTVLRRQHLAFEVLQLRRDIALRAFQCLAALVVVRCLGRLPARQLYVVAVHTVVANLQRRQARPRPFPRLQVSEIAVRVLADIPQLVEYRIEAGCQYAAVADELRRQFNQCAHQQVVGGAVITQPTAQPGEQGGIEPGELRVDTRHETGRRTELREIARTR